MPTAYLTKQVVGTASTGTYSTLYSTGASTTAIVSSVTVCNESTSSVTIRMGFDTTAGTPASGEFIVYDAVIAGNDTLVLNLPLTMGNPTFPRVQVKRAINETITTMALDAVRNYDFTFDGSTYVYVLPVGATDVTGVTTETLDSSGRWALVRHWRIDWNYWPDGATEPRAALELLESPTPGRTVRVQYLSSGAALTDSDEFSVSGLPSSSEDVVRLGAMYRLVSTVDPGKLIATSVSADAMDQPVPAGRGIDVSKYLYQLYSVRLGEEKTRQAERYVRPVNYER